MAAEPRIGTKKIGRLSPTRRSAAATEAQPGEEVDLIAYGIVQRAALLRLGVPAGAGEVLGHRDAHVAGGLRRQASPVYSVGKHEAAPALFSWEGGAMLYAHQGRPHTIAAMLALATVLASLRACERRTWTSTLLAGLLAASVLATATSFCPDDSGTR